MEEGLPGGAAGMIYLDGDENTRSRTTSATGSGGPTTGTGDAGGPRAAPRGQRQPSPPGHQGGHQYQANNNNDTSFGGILRQITGSSPEVATSLAALQQYIPFILILIAKALFDHFTGKSFHFESVNIIDNIVWF